jgi:hypothetical protein
MFTRLDRDRGDIGHWRSTPRREIDPRGSRRVDHGAVITSGFESFWPVRLRFRRSFPYLVTVARLGRPFNHVNDPRSRIEPSLTPFPLPFPARDQARLSRWLRRL